jgi:hypothetical protein
MSVRYIITTLPVNTLRIEEGNVSKDVDSVYINNNTHKKEANSGVREPISQSKQQYLHRLSIFFIYWVLARLVFLQNKNAELWGKIYPSY